jgi:ribosomal protein S27AE
MKLTGQDVHKAFAVSYPYLEPDWSKLKSYSQQGYENVACELNKMLEQDRVTITAVRCPQCTEVLQAEHAEGHACWQKNDSQIDVVLGEYCRSLQTQSEEMLKFLVEDYGLESSGQNKPSYIDALVKDYRKQLEGDK